MVNCQVRQQIQSSVAFSQSNGVVTAARNNGVIGTALNIARWLGINY